MVKVLIYGSKELYDNSSYEGRAEADIVLYRDKDDTYHARKNRTGRYIGKYLYGGMLEHVLNRIENDEWEADMKSYKLQQKYKDHHLIELSKNG